MFRNEASVAVVKCGEYDAEFIKSKISSMAEMTGVHKIVFTDKKITLKLNLVMKKSPELAVTTHPAVVEATILWLTEFGVNPRDITIADSFGGPYTEGTMRTIYRACGIEEVALRLGVMLNYDMSYKSVSNPNARLLKVFNVIVPVTDADIVINLCKLKTHALTGLSGAVKNFFGIIPGVEKFETHARYPDLNDFSDALNDVALWVHSSHATVISICDAVVGMEGNGPTSGSPRKIGALLMSENSFLLDAAAAHILHLGNTVKTIELAKTRELIPADGISDLSLYGDDIESMVIKDYQRPDSDHNNFFMKFPNMFGGRIVKFFEPKPIIDAKKCVSCSECVTSCPVHTISLEVAENGNKKRKKTVKIHYDKCIKCFCCQELCPYGAVRIRKNPLLKLFVP